MATKVELELVTPEQLLLSAQADMVVVPGGEGDFGVLPEHAPMIATVRPGVVDIYDNNQITDRIFIAGGFAEVTEERCTLLAEEAIRVNDIDATKAQEALEDAQAKVEAADTDMDRRIAAEALRVAEAMNAVVRHG